MAFVGFLFSMSFLVIYQRWKIIKTMVANNRENSFNMTRGGGGWRYWGGLWTFLDTWKGVSEKIVGLGGGAPKICLLQNQKEGGGGGGS